MISRGIRQAVHEDKEQIALLWITCFGERREAIDCFLDTVFSGKDCLVHIEDERLVAMVHMLPAHIAVPGGKLQAHYIYAAATHPDYRSKGLMGRLLAQAFAYGESRGDVCSFLLPSEPSLYDYYGRHGYLPYFRTRFVDIDSVQLGLSGGHEGDCETEQASSLSQPEQAVHLRNSELAKHPGSILWPPAYVDYASQVNGIYGGHSSVLRSRSGDPIGYALHTAPVAGMVEVSEIFTAGNSWRHMLNHTVKVTGASRLRIRLPEHSQILPGEGTTTTFGMARPLGGFALPVAPIGSSPYLGLTLD